ncbi:uncharacterized protein LOC141685789 [Apium graveolens]|uniref:uncharacterized protein LOC141685789 n=1 Tax=Apium graveolens TaxID=4045 RepID=UPI003D7AE28F
MTEAPLLAKPSPDDILYLYLVVFEQAVSIILVKEEQKLQKPVYYMSKVLHGAELNYSTTEKFALALITASRKLRLYIHAHKIEVLTDQPLKNILHSPKATGRLIKLVIELEEFDIKYEPQIAIKAQALEDFVVECTISDQEVGGLILQSPEGFMIEYTLKLDFPTMNNEVEYKALIVGLGLAKAVRAKNLKIYGDSRLVVAQVNGEFETKNYTMAKYLRVVKRILIQFDECLGPLEAEEVFKEAHEGICGQHLRGKALVYKITQLGFYWPTMLADTKAYVKKCDRCQRIQEYCDDNSKELRFTSVAHPRENEKAKVDNRIILDGLKKRVEHSRNTWEDELLPILWAYRTTYKVITEATTFMLAYVVKYMVHLEITHGSPRVKAYGPETNKEGMRLALDLINELRDEANARNAEHQ